MSTIRPSRVDRLICSRMPWVRWNAVRESGSSGELCASRKKSSPAVAMPCPMKLINRVARCCEAAANASLMAAVNSSAVGSSTGPCCAVAGCQPPVALRLA